jgi:DNA-directed RNA polymerase subunit RPC12/RpoP
MSKKRTHSELEHLRGEIKALKAENRSLLKQLKQLEKREHFYESQDEEVCADAEDTKRPDCKDCGKGITYIIDLGKFQYRQCPICGHREKVNG